MRAGAIVKRGSARKAPVHPDVQSKLQPLARVVVVILVVAIHRHLGRTRPLDANQSNCPQGSKPPFLGSCLTKTTHVPKVVQKIFQKPYKSDRFRILGYGSPNKRLFCAMLLLLSNHRKG